MKLRGEQAQLRMREDYYANADLRNDDDPSAFDRWATKWQNDNSAAVLNSPDGTAQFSALEISKSNFNERLSDGARAVHSEHIAHRVSERERMAEETAGNLGATRLDAIAGVGPNLLAQEDRDYAGMGRALQDTYYNAETGQAAFGGMNKSKASVAMADTIITKAVSEKDSRLLAIADNIITPGGTLAGSKYFRDKADDARLKIASINYQDMLRKEQIGALEAEGTHEQRMKIHGDRYQATNNLAAKNLYLDTATQKILAYPNFERMSEKELQQQAMDLSDLRKVDSEAALKLEDLIEKAKTNKETAHNK
ncbi:MAG: hypothetical protein ACRD2L_01750, partial [Terriglobia bacterium]